MGKKILKAMVLGLLELGIIADVFRVLVAFGWLPMIVMIILKVLHIHLDDVEYIGTLFISMALGMVIFWYMTRCIAVVKYQEKNNCTFKQAWGATGTYEIDD